MFYFSTCALRIEVLSPALFFILITHTFFVPFFLQGSYIRKNTHGITKHSIGASVISYFITPLLLFEFEL